MAHRGDAVVQREAEALIRDRAATLVGKSLASATVTFDTGAAVQVDGVADDESVLVEIFAHQGKLKGGQQRKVALDALKLITLGRSRPGTQLILAFADDEAAAYARGNGWLAQALSTWNVTVLVIELDDEDRKKIRAAQIVQEMRYPDDDSPSR